MNTKELLDEMFLKYCCILAGEKKKIPNAVGIHSLSCVNCVKESWCLENRSCFHTDMTKIITQTYVESINTLKNKL